MSSATLEAGSSMCLAIGGAAGLFCMMLQLLEAPSTQMAWASGSLLVAGLAAWFTLARLAERRRTAGAEVSPITKIGGERASDASGRKAA